MTGKTVWDECQRRGGCLVGLRGIKVTTVVDGVQVGMVVRSSAWTADGALSLRLTPEGGGEDVYKRSSECVLAGRWPMVCCPPVKRKARP
jgi:hypothetical protein